jgi:hypothetical protein
MNYLDKETDTDNEVSPLNTRPGGDELSLWKQDNTLRGWQALQQSYSHFSLVERQKNHHLAASKWANHANDCGLVVQCLQAGRDPTEAIAHYQQRLENWYRQLARNSDDGNEQEVRTQIRSFVSEKDANTRI